MSMPSHASPVADAAGLGLGAGDDAEADVVGRGDGELDRRTCADPVRSGFAEPSVCNAGIRLGKVAGPVRLEVVLRCWPLARALS
jgi:hypothetical protein